MQSNPAAGVYGTFEFDISKAVAHISQAIQEINNLTKKTGEAEKAIAQKSRSSSALGKSLDAESAAAKKAADAASRYAADTNKAAMSSNLLSRELSSLSGVLASLTVAAVAGQMLRFASDIEDGFVGVKRTTGVAGEAFQSLRTDILQLTGDLRGMDTRSIQDVATIAGQMGLAIKDIPSYTEVVSKASIALEMGAESSANFLARIGLNMKVPVDQYIKIANTSAQLANTTNATAEEIMEISQRMSGTASVLGLKPQEVLALATSSRQAGVEIEVAGTAWTQVMSKMLTDTKRFAHVAGVDIKSFTDMLKNDPIKAIEAFATGLSKLNKFGQVAALEDLQLDGARVGQVLIKLAGNVEDFHDNLKTANAEWEHGSSVERSYEAAASTLSASMKQAWNSVKLLSDSMIGGSGLRDALRNITNELSMAVRWVAGYGESLDAAAKKQSDLVEKTGSLHDALDKLASKTDRTAEEQSTLNTLAEDLRKILPELTIKYDEHGNVIGIVAEKYHELAAAQRESAKAAQDAATADLQAQHIAVAKGIWRLEEVLKAAKERNQSDLLSSDLDPIPPDIREYSDRKSNLDRDFNIKTGQYTYGQFVAELEAGLNSLKRKREELYKQLAPKPVDPNTFLVPKADKPIQFAKPWERDPFIFQGTKTDTGKNYVPIEDTKGDKEKFDPVQASLEIAKQQADLDRRRAMVTAKSAEERTAIEKKYYADLAALSEKQLSHSLTLASKEDDAGARSVALKSQHATDLQRIELDRSEAIRTIREKSTEESKKSNEELRKEQQESFKTLQELSRQQIDLDRRKALSTAQTAEEQIAAEREYFDSLKKLADEQAANDISYLEQSENYQEKILAIEEKNRIEREKLEQDFFDARKDIQDKAHEEELRAVERHNRELERRAQEGARSFRTAIEPLLRGADFKDFFKNLMFDDLMDALAAQFKTSLPFGNGQGGIFGSLLGGITNMFTNGVSAASASGNNPTTSILESGQMGLTASPSKSWSTTAIPINLDDKSGNEINFSDQIESKISQSITAPKIQRPEQRFSLDSISVPKVFVNNPMGENLGGVTNQSTSSTTVNMHINTGGAPFDQAAATSLKQTIKGIVEKTFSDDKRRNGRITQQSRR